MPVNTMGVIIIGLIFDIVGACYIVGPWMYFSVWTNKKTAKDAEEKSMRGMDAETEEKNKQRALILIGFGFLVVGFLLQILGNLYLHPPLI